MKGKLHHAVSMYASWFAQNYSLIARINASVPSLRIISDEFSKDKNEIIFTVQLAGKNIFPKISASNLFNDQSLFLNFCEEDQQKIANALPKEKSRVLKKIVSRTYDRNTKQFLFSVESVINGKVEYLSAAEIAEKYNYLKNFDEKDCFLIGLEIGKLLA